MGLQGTEQADQPPAQLMRSMEPDGQHRAADEAESAGGEKDRDQHLRQGEGERGGQAAQKLLRRCHDMDDPAVHQGLTAPKQVEEKREQDRGEQG